MTNDAKVGDAVVYCSIGGGMWDAEVIGVHKNGTVDLRVDTEASDDDWFEVHQVEWGQGERRIPRFGRRDDGGV